jgi:hypothetical protein
MIKIFYLIISCTIFFFSCNSDINYTLCSKVYYFDNDRTISPDFWVRLCAESAWTPKEFKFFILKHVHLEKDFFRKNPKRSYTFDDLKKAYNKWKTGWTPDQYICPDDSYWKEFYDCPNFASRYPYMYTTKSIGSFKACFAHLFFLNKNYPPFGNRVKIKYWFALWQNGKRYCAPITNRDEMFQWRGLLTCMSAWIDVIEPFAKNIGYNKIFVLDKPNVYTCKDENLKMQENF